MTLVLLISTYADPVACEITFNLKTAKSIQETDES